MTPADFGQSITGLAYVDGELTVRDLDKVGRQLVVEKRRAVCPLNTYEKEALQAWLIENAQEDGWIVDSYLGSQRSVDREGDSTVLNYSVRKYVPIEGAAP
jgi:hypothetical protein